ncbi:MAG: ABC transporter substrate-binding protein [Ruminococcaceae bacterium]|nr:ABC transporter substrate-binding protein [Oscillospiraceae bacterium]
MKRNTKLVALLLVLVMALSLVACNKPSNNETPGDQYTGGDTLVVGYDLFSQKFSPFFATTAYDQDVAGMTQVGLLTSDREGNMILNGIEGETNKFNGTDYTYKGIANCKITKNDDGTITYAFTLRNDVKFSDGSALTADDVIFTMYVLSDPTYNGSSTFYAQPIVGMKEYRSGVTALSNLLLADGPDATSEYYTAEQAAYYWNAFNEAGLAFAKATLDDIIATYADSYAAYFPNRSYAEAAAFWGYDDVTTEADFWAALVENYGYDISDTGINYEKVNTSIVDLIEEKLGDKADEYAAGVVVGDSAASITGIKKTGEYSLEITMSKYDATSIYQLAVSVAPLHYYGSDAEYDYAANKFGFKKGDLSGVKAKTTAPMGAGAYKFVKYENGVVRFERNEHYYKGAPKIKYINFQETDAGNKFAGVSAGTFDITDPNFDTATVDAIKEANGGNLSGNKVTTYTVDNLGYGYIGICANTVKVGTEKDSDASKSLRKAFATLFSVYRQTVIDSYYGDRASVINYPISNTSWAAPKPADEGYQVAYSVGVDGNAIYTANMTEEEKYTAALAAAVEYLKAAGFTYADGKFTAAPEGAALSYNVIIPADGIGDHPVYAVFTKAKAALATIGIELTITDPSDSNVLWNALEAGECQIWAAAWGATIDPDMYQVYHSSNIVGLEGSTESNHYSITDDELDELIMNARESEDQAFRKSTYKACLDIILDWAVEVPTYQRQNAIIASTTKVNVETMTPDITTFWGWMNDIELLEMN